ncbi:MAG: hypothetical protein M3068_09350, partial [Gemmatimonadota bacterium]|nr:hypothetical protein [Gemmatimonadota bacterium]
MDVPGIGGLSTACYELFRRILGDGHDAYLLNLIRERDIPLFEQRFGAIAGNPAGVPRVGNCRLGTEPADPQSALATRIAAIDPAIVVAFGHVAARLVKGAAPERRTIFMTGTCRQAQDYVTQGLAPDAVSLAEDLARGRISTRIVHRDEQHAVATCDLVVTNSALTLAMMERFYATSLGKVYPKVVSKAEWICNGAEPWRGRARPFTDRDIDVCFIASDWTRPEKNYRWVAALAATLRAATIHLVGDVPRRISGVT